MNLIKNQSVAAHLDDLRIQHWHFVLICLGIIVTERRVQQCTLYKVRTDIESLLNSASSELVAHWNTTNQVDLIRIMKYTNICENMIQCDKLSPEQDQS